MLIVLTGLQPTLWFADVRGAVATYTYRKFLFARVVQAGKPLICAMCVITKVNPDRNWLIGSHTSFYVRELGLGLTLTRPGRALGVGVKFENVRTAKAYAIKCALDMLVRGQTRELLLCVADMYNEADYENWELVCL